MTYVKKLFYKMRDIYEIGIPTIAFSMMFCVFIWGILCRYILKMPATWSIEVQVAGYVWAVLPAALWVRRRNDHVTFSLLYDMLKPRGQRIIRMLGNIFMLVTYSFLFVGAIRHLMFLRQTSMALELPLRYMYLPFSVLVGGVWIYSLTDIIRDIRDIVWEKQGRKPPINETAIDKAEEFLKASEKEYEEFFDRKLSDEDSVLDPK